MGMVGIGIEICIKKKGNKRIMDSFCIWLYGEKVELKPKKKKKWLLTFFNKVLILT